MAKFEPPRILNLSHYVKSYGHFCQTLTIFTMPAYQIWSCHVTQEANFEFFLFFPNSTFNIGKVTKFLVEKLSTSEVTSEKFHRGLEDTPLPPPLPLPLGLTMIHKESSFNVKPSKILK